jgi:heme exporter protein C
MMVATKLYYVASLFGRVRADLIELEGGKDWVRRIAVGDGVPAEPAREERA